MIMPDETAHLSPEPIAPVAEPVLQLPASEGVRTVASTVETTEASPDAPATQPVDEPPAVTPVAIKRGPAKPLISDDTLAEWQAALAKADAAKQRAARDAQAARERTEAFRQLRSALRRLEAGEPDDEGDAMRADPLAMAVHQAPEHVRTVIDATMRLLAGTPRR